MRKVPAARVNGVAEMETQVACGPEYERSTRWSYAPGFETFTGNDTAVPGSPARRATRSSKVMARSCLGTTWTVRLRNAMTCVELFETMRNSTWYSPTAVIDAGTV